MNLRWVPLENTIQNSQYQNFSASVPASTNSAEWYTASNMIHISADAIVSGGGVHTYYGGDAKDPRADFRSQLGKLCGDLGVDAVAVIELDMAFEKPGFSVSFGRGYPATPKVASTVVLVNKDGEVAVNTGLYSKGGGEYFSGKKIMMLSNLTTDEVFLNDKSVLSYCEAIEKAALAVKEDIMKAFGKLK